MEILAQVEKVINLECFSRGVGGVVCLYLYLQTLSCTLPILLELTLFSHFYCLVFVQWERLLLFVTSPNAWGGPSGFICQQGSKEQWVVMGKLSCKVEHLRVQFRWSLVAL